MKKILKSMLVIFAVMMLVVTSTYAWFTSTVTALNNEITVGTLQLAVDEADGMTYGGVWGTDAWEVVRENADGSVTQSTTFTPWVNAAPDDINPYYIGVRNRGTISANIRSYALGAWTAGPRLNGTNGCPVLADANADLIKVATIHQYATTPTGGCESAIGCRNMRDALQTGSWTPVGGLTALDANNVTGLYFGTTTGTGLLADSYFALAENEFVVYRIDLQLDNTANDCYQGATYQFDFTVEGKQVAASTW
jgi:predicted ribosomally synthesized peptide with SipW-like signal peptide